MANYNDNNPIVLFCLSSSEFGDCQAFFEEHYFSSITEFLADSNGKCQFADFFPDIAIGRFCRELETFKKAQEEAELERQRNATDEIKANLTTDIKVNLACNNDGCSTIITELLERLNENNREMTSLRERQNEHEVYVRNEFKKIIPEAEKAKAKKNSDTWLFDTWKVSNKSLYYAANDHGNSGVTKFFDKVFTQKLLRNYTSVNTLPNRDGFKLKAAFEELLDLLADAKEEAGTEPDSITAKAKDKKLLDTRFYNWTYQAKKKSELELQAQEQAKKRTLPNEDAINEDSSEDHESVTKVAKR